MFCFIYILFTCFICITYICFLYMLPMYFPQNKDLKCPKNEVFDSSFNVSIPFVLEMKQYTSCCGMVCNFLSQILYVEKFLLSSYKPKCPEPIMINIS